MPPSQEEVLKFTAIIEELVYQKDIPYMEAILLHCEQTGLEVEVAASLIPSSLKNQIHLEASRLNLLPKANSLPL